MFRLLWIFSFILAVGCDTPYTGQTLRVNDIDRTLDELGDGEILCLSDGFDKACIRQKIVIEIEEVEVEVPVEVVREVEVPVEVVREVEVPVEVVREVEVPVEVVREVEVPVEVVREVEVPVEVPIYFPPKVLRLTIYVPESPILGTVSFQQGGITGTVSVEEDRVIVETDTTLDISPISPTNDPISVDIPINNPPQTPEPPNNPPQTPELPNNQGDGGYTVRLHKCNNGSRCSGVVHSDFIEIERDGDQIRVWHLGSDMERDPWDSSSIVIAIETGYTYEEASDRARTILGDYIEAN